MSRILVISKHALADAMVATSLVGRLVDDGNTVHCMSGQQTIELFRFCGAHSMSVGTPRQEYDIAINLSPAPSCTRILSKVVAAQKLGYGQDGDSLTFLNVGADQHYRARVVGIPTDANLFQLTFGLAQMTWHGEGYCVKYFPRNKTKKNTVGIAVRDSRLSSEIMKNLNIAKGRLWHIPFKTNTLRQIDETNRCKTLITDDEGIAHVALALRKRVELLVRRPPAYRLEMFNSGSMHVLKREE